MASSIHLSRAQHRERSSHRQSPRYSPPASCLGRRLRLPPPASTRPSNFRLQSHSRTKTAKARVHRMSMCRVYGSVVINKERHFGQGRPNTHTQSFSLAASSSTYRAFNRVAGRRADPAPDASAGRGPRRPRPRRTRAPPPAPDAIETRETHYRRPGVAVAPLLPTPAVWGDRRGDRVPAATKPPQHSSHLTGPRQT